MKNHPLAGIRYSYKKPKGAQPYDPFKGNEKEAFLLCAAVLIFFSILIYVLYSTFR